MGTKTRFGIELQKQIDSGCSLKEISQWVSQIISQYSFTETGEIDMQLVDLMVELIELENVPQSDDRKDRVRAIADQLIHQETPSKVQLGWGIQQKLTEGLSSSAIREW